MSRSKRKKGKHYFVQLMNEMIDSPKWKELSNSSKVLYIRVLRKYKVFNNGEIYLPYSELMDEFSKGTISKAIKELVKVGAIRVTKYGGLHREYALYEVVTNWWRNKLQPQFLNHLASKNATEKGVKAPPHVQKL